MLLEIITPIKTLYYDEVALVRLPGSIGVFEIMKNHTAIVSSLEKGVIKVIDKNKETLLFEISGGVIDCKSNKIVVLADSGKAVQI